MNITCALPCFRRVALIGLLLGLTQSLYAQTVYRSVDSKGRVTYSDQPIESATPAPVAPSKAESGGTSQNGTLPFALRQTMAQYPLTLYTAPGCSPCNSARSLLVARGAPFVEKTVVTQPDIEALKRISGESSLPLLALGSQQLRGLVESEWNQYLDLAGYPAVSQLPPGYRFPPATALVPPAPEPVVEPVPVERVTAPPPAAPPRTSPQGIQF